MSKYVPSRMLATQNERLKDIALVRGVRSVQRLKDEALLKFIMDNDVTPAQVHEARERLADAGQTNTKRK